MAKIITIKAPAVHTSQSAALAEWAAQPGDPTTIDVIGQVAWLKVAGKRHKCFINREGNAVSDYSTGARISTLGGAWIDLQMITGRYPRPRDAAQYRIDAIEREHGPTSIPDRISGNFPTLNK